MRVRYLRGHMGTHLYGRMATSLEGSILTLGNAEMSVDLTMSLKPYNPSPWSSLPPPMTINSFTGLPSSAFAFCAFLRYSPPYVICGLSETRSVLLAAVLCVFSAL
jgi:hypothetical protein